MMPVYGRLMTAAARMGWKDSFASLYDIIGGRTGSLGVALLQGRKAHGNRGALAQFARNIEPPPMALDNVLDDCQPKAGPARSEAAPRICAIEPTGQVRHILWRNPVPASS